MAIINEIKNWLLDGVKDKLWWVRLPLLVYFVYVLVKLLGNPDYSCILAPLNLGIHELGHLLFGFSGEFCGVAAGTAVELSAPFLLMVNFYRQKDSFSITLCFGWLSVVLFDIARYVADGRAMELPLVRLFGSDDSVIHDWNYLLSKIGLLQFDLAIALLLRIGAVFFMAICLAGGGWLLWKMALGNGGKE